MPSLLEFLFDLSLWLDKLVCHSHIFYAGIAACLCKRASEGLQSDKEQLDILNTWNFVHRGSFLLELRELIFISLI